MIEHFIQSTGLALALAMAAGLAAPAAAAELREIESPGAAKHHGSAFRSDTIEMNLAPAGDARSRQEVEFSIRLKKGDVLVYSLETPGAPAVYHEFHGHTAEQVSFYKKASGASHHGSFVAPFDGLHGWWIDNRGATPAKATLKLSGFYELIPPGDEGNEYGIEPVKQAAPR